MLPLVCCWVTILPSGFVKVFVEVTCPFPPLEINVLVDPPEKLPDPTFVGGEFSPNLESKVPDDPLTGLPFTNC